ncbi:aldose epimerase family protein [Rossellomorea vietnamensis]|uniref:Aldose 1-epimerase n=1 Tax=Rossellomorea vietnamensis TaxID=218284 RepID=A0A0P6WDY9_9BACI|nr:aldose epimerase family protein [Rossellomorea vietnamensis]KPL59261.1 aldose epimerase [Rossellomorea vietnamensis]
MNLAISEFGKREGKKIIAHTISNSSGMQITSINYGCIITKLIAPDRNGNLENIVLGFDTLEEYDRHSPYFGAVIGRHAGRIAGRRFTLDGITYRLAKNDEGNHLHGGLKGFDKTIWDVEIKEGKDSISLVYHFLSKDGAEGYPGSVDVKVIYTLTEKNELFFSYEAVSDKRTILNMTNHTYFNLSGNLKTTIEQHELTLKSNQFLTLNEALIPTGEAVDVEGTVFDFRTGRRIQDGIESAHPQTRLAGNGYDHPFLLEKAEEQILLTDHESGRTLIMETNQPAVVLYTGNQLEGNVEIRGTKSQSYLGLCLETQGIPDAIHHPQFQTTVIEKGEPYKSITKLTFGTV